MYVSKMHAFDDDRHSAVVKCDLENNKNKFLGLPSQQETHNYVRSLLTPDRVVRFTIP
ncbi:hypothetical protein SKAU_G00407850, partial [Synaphobranchus kaupii]